MPLTLIEAGTQDLQALSALHRELFSPSWSPDEFAALMEQPGSVALLAIVPEADRPVGFILGRVIADEAEILTLGVAGDWQRRGIASRLVAAFSRWSAGRGASHIFLEVAEDNRAARQLYLTQGFRETGRRPRYYERPTGTPVDALIMSKTIER